MLVLLAGVALVLGVACGGDDDGGDEDTDGVSTSAPAATESSDDGDGEEEEEPTEASDEDEGSGDDDGGSSETASIPDDPCTLLTADEVATMVPDSQAPEIRTGDEPEVEIGGCFWSSSSAPISMELTLISLPAEVPPEDIIAGTEADLESAGATPVEDLGEVAGVVSNRENSAELVAYVKGLQMSLSWSGVDAVDTDQLIALGKIIEENL
jgi:hypothetical protein